MSYMTLKELKKRIFHALQEYSVSDGEICFCDTNREKISEIMPETISSCLVRMYESLPIGEKNVKLLMTCPEVLYCKKTLEENTESILLEKTDVCCVFDYCGSGDVVFADINGTESISISCKGNDAESTYKGFISLENAGEYTINTTDNLKVRNFVLYDKASATDATAFPPMGYVGAGLPDDFDRILGRSDVYVISDDKKHLYVSKIYGNPRYINLEYKAKPQQVCVDTDEETVIDLQPLACDALVCLCASELCHKTDTDLYTRLYYKYNDLCEGLRRTISGTRQNVFFSSRRKAGR